MMSIRWVILTSHAIVLYQTVQQWLTYTDAHNCLVCTAGDSMLQSEHMLVMPWATDRHCTDRHCTCDSHVGPTIRLSFFCWTAFVEVPSLLESFIVQGSAMT